MLKVLKSGFYTTIQDLGRNGLRNKGVPVSGVMDELAVTALNNLLGNKTTDAVLEITIVGPKLEFSQETIVTLGGAIFDVVLNGEAIKNYQIQHVKKGDIIEYGGVKEGVRGYLAIQGGFKSEKILKSRSQYFPITPKQCLEDNDALSYTFFEEFNQKEFNPDTNYLSESDLCVFRGPEFNILTDRQLGQLFGIDFTVAKENNRMAYQLEETLDEHSKSMLTSATLPGTVQLTPSGKLIILMKDGQTTGGYPRILQLSNKAISILSQKKTGDTLCFKIIQ